MSKTLVRKYYSAAVQKEWRRLTKDPYHQLELETTFFFLKKYLPKKALILDAGGGPGRYTIELARAGYDMVLLDLTPALLDIARKQIRKADVESRVRKVLQGSIDDLSVFKDNTFDAVVCLGGPLSHLVNRKAREKAISELSRVVKVGGLLFVSVIGRLAVLASELVRFPQEIENKRIFQSIQDTGDYAGGYGFTACHFFLPEELKKVFERKGVRVLEMAGLEGLASGHAKELNRVFRQRPRARKIWRETHLKTCTHPVAVGQSEHFLLVGRKEK